MFGWHVSYVKGKPPIATYLFQMLFMLKLETYMISFACWHFKSVIVMPSLCGPFLKTQNFGTTECHGPIFTKQDALGWLLPTFPTFPTDILRWQRTRRLGRHCSCWILLLGLWEAGRRTFGSGAGVLILLWPTTILSIKPLLESCKIFLGLGIFIVKVVIIIPGTGATGNLRCHELIDSFLLQGPVPLGFE